MEGQALHLQKQIEEQAETAQASGIELLKVRLLPASSTNPSPGIPIYLLTCLLDTEFVPMYAKSLFFNPLKES